MHAVLIENPLATHVTPARRRVVERALEATFDLDILSTEAPGHAADLAREAVAAGAKTVVIYGGDGTVHEAVNGLLRVPGGAEVTLGLLPGGGTNVLARNLGYPNDLVEAAGHLLERVDRGETRPTRLGRMIAVGDHARIERYFLFGAGLGLDAGTVRRVNASGLRPRFGDLAFLLAGLQTFFDLRSARHPGLVVETEGGPRDAWWATVCNDDPYTYFGSRPLRVAPDAGRDPGLDLVAGRTAKVVRTSRWLRQTLSKGKHTGDPEILHLPAQDHVTIRTRRPTDLQTDGEYLGRVRRLEAVTGEEIVRVWA